MSPRFSVLFGWIFLAGALVTGSASAQMAASQEVEAIQIRPPIERFNGRVAIRTPEGTVREVQVVIRNWTIDNRRKIAHFPEEGFLIVQLRAGELVTVIDGKRQGRKSDEFWTVPAGSSMSIETGNDSAVIQTVAIRNPG